MSTSWGVFAMALLSLTVASAAAVSAAEPPYALVLAQAAGRAGQVVPVTVPVDFAQVASALGSSAANLTTPVVAATEGAGGKLAPIAAQFDPVAPGAAAGELTLMLPAGTSRQRVRIYFAGGAPKLAAPEVPRIEVQQAGGAVVIATPHYRLTHDPARMGGLPGRIEFPATGKVCDTFKLNDRIHIADQGGFRLGDDQQPRIEVLSAGPLRACVRVTARYLQGEKAPASAPRAEYRFTYYANSPLVRVSAHMTQTEAFTWPELHLWELNYPDETFTHWLTGEPEAGGPLAANKSEHEGGVWSGLTDGANVVGIVGQHARIYDGRKDYGTYIHGPWVTWSGTDQRLDVTLWLGSVPQAQAAATLRAAAGEVAVARWATVTVKPLEDQLASLDRAIGGLPRADQPRWRWIAQLARRYAAAPGHLQPAIGLARQMAALAARKSPVATAEAALRKAGSQSLAILCNNAVGWAFETTVSGLQPVSCFDFATQCELLSASPTPLWEAVLQRPDKSPLTVSAADAASCSAQASGAQANLRWRLPDSLGGAQVSATVTLEGPAASWRVKLERLQPGWSVREVAFPRVAVGPIGRSGEDEYLLLPQGSGVLRKAPLRASVAFSGTYPDGWSAFQLMAYYDRDAGLYFACHDPLGSTKQIVTSRTADGEGQMLTYNWYAPDMGVPDNAFATSAPTVIRPFRGDWFDATQLYRAWAEKEAQWWPRDTAWDRPDTPRWLREVCVWVCTSGSAAEMVKKTKDFAAFMGAPTALHWYSWHQIPFDVEYPHYFPVKPGMEEGVKELQAAGVRVMPYINGRLWDTALEDFKQTAIAAATKGEDGKPYIEEYGSGAKLAPMCPTQKLWQDQVQDIVLRLVTEVGVDGVYIDQIGAAAPRLCMDKSHGHPLGGGHWWTQDGYWPLLDQLQARLPEGKMITTECNAEAYARMFDAYLTWHWQNQDMVPAFSAIYAGRIQLFSRAYNGNDQQAHCMKIGQQLVFGEQLGWLDPGGILPTGPDDPKAPTADFMRRAAQTRHALLDFLSWGRMARPPVVEGSIPEVTADWAWSGKWMVADSALQRAAWWAEDGRLLLLFANTSDQPVSGTLAFDAAAYGWPKTAELTVTPQQLAGPGQPEARAARFRRPLEVGPRGIVALVVRRAEK